MKASGKYNMCVDYTYINRVCLKDSSLPNIDKHADNSVGYKVLSFMDAYCGYNQIHMIGPEHIKTTFMIAQASY